MHADDECRAWTLQQHSERQNVHVHTQWCCSCERKTSSDSVPPQVMATGGLSFPKMGTDGTGHRIVQRLGHSIHPVYPALTPLKGSHPADGQLAGNAALLSRPLGWLSQGLPCWIHLTAPMLLLTC